MIPFIMFDSITGFKRCFFTLKSSTIFPITSRVPPLAIWHAAVAKISLDAKVRKSVFWLIFNETILSGLKSFKMIENSPLSAAIKYWPWAYTATWSLSTDSSSSTAIICIVFWGKSLKQFLIVIIGYKYQLIKAMQIPC